MTILVINTGSSSIKYRLIDMNTENTIVHGSIECTGSSDMIPRHGGSAGIQQEALLLKGHQAAFRHLVSILPGGHGICAIGHRVAHGGSRYTSPVVVTEEVMADIDSLAELAPLHNRANLLGIQICKEVFGDAVPQVAVFDTAFHKDMPPHAFLYPLPYRYYKDHGIRRFGFHGMSHRYVSERCSLLMGQKGLRIITCHIGNGCSVSAIRDGVCIDTSMGFTPNEGIMMGTRSGSVDPAVLSYAAKCEGITYEEVLRVSNSASGLLGISGMSCDYRDLTQNCNERTALAVRMQQYQILKTVGSYLAVLNGTDAIVFTGGIGEHVPELRRNICEQLGYAGIILDEKVNASVAGEACISKAESEVKVFVIPTNEELIIARDTAAVLSGQAMRTI